MNDSLTSTQNTEEIDLIEIIGIENRIEQILANLLENSISFSEDNKNITVKLYKDNKKAMLDVIDQGLGFKEKDTEETSTG